MTGRRFTSLTEALGIDICSRPSRTEMISIVGGGGKTSSLCVLLAEFAGRGLCSLGLTTTKMADPTGSGPEDLRVVFSDDPSGPASMAADKPGAMFLAGASEPLAAAHKIGGFCPHAVDRAARAFPEVNFMIEADGSRGLPLKAPAGHEPVIPSLSTIILVLVGADALMKPLVPEEVHRFEIFSALTGLGEGQCLDPEGLGKVTAGSRGYGASFPPGSKVCLAANRADLLDSQSLSKVKGFLARLAALRPEISRVILCSVRNGWYDLVS